MSEFDQCFKTNKTQLINSLHFQKWLDNNNLTIFVHQKSLMLTATCFSTTQYPFRILYLPTHTNLKVYWYVLKTGFECCFERFLSTDKKIIRFLMKKLMYLKATQHKFLALNTYLSFFIITIRW